MYIFAKKIISYALATSVLIAASFTVYAQTSSTGQKSFGNSNRYGKVTPALVYSIAQNYENLFLYYVKNHKSNLTTAVTELEPIPFSGMTPEDVFVRLNRLNLLMDRLAKSVQVEPVEKITREKGKAIPAEVFLAVANNLDTLNSVINKLEPGKNWGQFYNKRTYDKPLTPSDVYALVDLSVRRLNLVVG